MTFDDVPDVEIDFLIQLLLHQFFAQNGVFLNREDTTYRFIPPRRGTNFGIELRSPEVTSPQVRENLFLRVYLVFRPDIQSFDPFKKETLGEDELEDGYSAVYVAYAYLRQRNFPSLAQLIVNTPIQEPLEKVVPVVFSVPTGVYDEPQTVSLSTNTSGAQIFYAIVDGDPVPPEDYSLYTGPITVSTHVSIFAYATKAGMTQSTTTLLQLNFISAQLSRLTWELGCIADVPPIGCSCAAQVSESVVLQGPEGEVYRVRLRIRGLMELDYYTGGDHDGGNWQIGGDPSMSVLGTTVNFYRLDISDPPQRYFINRRLGGADFVNPPPFGNVDMQHNVYIASGATVTLFASSGGDSVQLKNNANESVTDDDPDFPIVVTQPFNGQFAQIDAVEIRNINTLNDGDPYFENVVLLISGRGANGSNSIKDLSKYEHVVDRLGSPTIETANSPFNDNLGSIRFNGSAGLRLSDAPHLRLTGATHWTIEMMALIRGPASGYRTLIAKRKSSGGVATSYELAFNNTDHKALYSVGGPNTFAPYPIMDQEWTHIALSYVNGTYYFHIAGEMQYSFSGVNVGSDTLAAAIPLCIGALETLSEGFNGNLAEIRITKDVSRYGSADIAPPVGRFKTY